MVYRGYVKIDQKYELVAIKTGKGDCPMISVKLNSKFVHCLFLNSSVGSYRQREAVERGFVYDNFHSSQCHATHWTLL